MLLYGECRERSGHFQCKYTVSATKIAKENVINVAVKYSWLDLPCCQVLMKCYWKKCHKKMQASSLNMTWWELVTLIISDQLKGKILADILILFPEIQFLSNSRLPTGFVPFCFNHAVVHHLIKKSNIDAIVPKHFWPIFKLHFFFFCLKSWKKKSVYSQLLSFFFFKKKISVL